MSIRTLAEEWDDRESAALSVRYRETSKLNWEIIRDSKLMAGSHFDLYTIVVSNPDITVAEITPIFNKTYGTDLSRGEMSKRMSNLHYNYKVITEYRQRICRVNGKECISYISNNLLPTPLPKKKKSKSQQIQELEAEVKRLTEIIIQTVKEKLELKKELKKKCVSPNSILRL